MPNHPLTEAEASARLAQFGPNRLAEERGESLWAKVLEELREPMILLLLIIGALYALLGEPSDAITIALIIAALLTIEIANERRATRAMAALHALAGPTATVRRADGTRELPSVVRGRGEAIVTATGAASELGRVAGLAHAANPPRTALQLAMRRLSGALVWLRWASAC